MEKRQLKLYGFKLKDSDIVNLFNASDLIGYEKDENGKWFCNGGKWIVNTPSYIIGSFYGFFRSNDWTPITEKEFDEIVSTDEDLREFDCKLISSDYPIERLFNRKIKHIEITTETNLSDFPSNAQFIDIDNKCYGEPMYYTMKDFENILSCGGDNSDFIGKYIMVY